MSVAKSVIGPSRSTWRVTTTWYGISAIRRAATRPVLRAVEQLAELVDQVDGRHSHRRDNEALEPHPEVETPAERQNGLEQKRMGSKDREQVLEP